MKDFLTIFGTGLLTLPIFQTLQIQTFAQFVSTPPPPAVSKQPMILKTENKAVKRHRMQIQVVKISDLKVKENSEILEGQIISDRTDERESLEAQLNQINISIKQLAIPLTTVAELPPANFSMEEAAIKRIEAEIELINQSPTPNFRFKTEELRTAELDKLQAQIKHHEAKSRLTFELNQAIAALDKARSNHQQKQYEHSLNLIRQQSETQRQQFQIASLVAQKQEIESKLREITQIKSPVSGKVRRIKNLGQKDRQINLEIVIDVKTD